MATGMSIHIGLNSVESHHYQGWSGVLKACEADAKDMEKLAKSKGFHSTLLLTKEATTSNVLSAINDAAKSLASGDILFLTYSGHGGQMKDTNGDEEDVKDETWVLYDRQLIDDELYALWAGFQPGVRILVLSDSCHSGSVIKRIQELRAIAETDIADKYELEGIPGTRALPPEVADRTYAAFERQYEDIQASNPDGEKVSISASILLLSGCQDDQLSADGNKNGLFTATLLKVWNNGKFKGSYRKFYQEITQQMPIWQVPNRDRVGPKNYVFESQNPFTI